MSRPDCMCAGAGSVTAQAMCQETDRARREAVRALHDSLRTGAAADDALWAAVVAYQGYPLYTASGLPFSYTVKRNRNGAYSGELVVSRKEGSKTLTRSSILLAFHRVQQKLELAQDADGQRRLQPAFYKGPKAIGQIFGISYIYSLFDTLGLIQAPPHVAARMAGGQES